MGDRDGVSEADLDLGVGSYRLFLLSQGKMWDSSDGA